MSFNTDNIITYYFSYHKHIIGLFLSTFKGWSVVNLNYTVGLVKHKELNLFPTPNKTQTAWLEAILFGLHRGYFHYLQLKGMGFKFIVAKGNIVLKIGYNHRILFLLGKDIYVRYLSKFLLKINCRSIDQLKWNIHSFLKTRKSNPYKKKGIFIKGSVIKLKLSSKKTKF